MVKITGTPTNIIRLTDVTYHLWGPLAPTTSYITRPPSYPSASYLITTTTCPYTIPPILFVYILDVHNYTKIRELGQVAKTHFSSVIILPQILWRTPSSSVVGSFPFYRTVDTARWWWWGLTSSGSESTSRAFTRNELSTRSSSRG